MTKRELKPSEPASLLPQLSQGAEVLIIRLRSLGDVALLTPALAAVHAWRPDLRLCVLVQPAFAPVLEGNPAVAEIMLHRTFLSTVYELRRRRFPIVFNQHGGPTSAFLTLLSGSPVRVCWAGHQFASFYNVRAPGPESFYARADVHTVEHRITQFYWTGLPRGPIPALQVFPQAHAADLIAEKLAERGIFPGQAYAVLHPGAAFFTRRWAVEGFGEVVRWLRESRDLAPVVVLGPGDSEIALAVRQRLAPYAVVFDSLSVRELIALVARARLFVGHDTGPTHLAVAAGRPVVMIFGASSPTIWRPWHVLHRVVLNDFGCRPCRGDRCYAFDEPRCILSVTFEQVRDACAALLEAES